MRFENHKHLYVIGALAGSVLTALPAAAAPPQGTGSSCSDEATTVSGDFEGGAFARCEVVGRGHFKLTITPEDAKVTNCSPWYAFQLSSAQAQQVTIDLDYGVCGHRYRPKFRVEGSDWQAIPLENVRVDKEKKSGNGKPIASATIQLAIPAGKTQVAAQPLLVSKDYTAWLDRVAQLPTVSRGLLGTSREGRPIEKITIREPGAATSRNVVLTGRQHPPETTGAIAMQAFVDRLLENDNLARSYRSRYTTEAIPLLNPDGVAHGHWRHNLGQTDLNRDWGPFAQPETQLMRALLETLNKAPEQRLRLFLDFHSTHYDTVYTLTDDAVTSPAGFTRKWLTAYQALVPDKKLRIEPGHNPGLPTAKSWVYEYYKVPTATYEIGDETKFEVIRRDARAAAEAMMSTLLDNDD